MLSPKFTKPAQFIPCNDKVNKELERLQQQGIIKPVQFSEWAAPIVPLLKSDGTIRICGDYRLTVNQASLVDTYPVPPMEDLCVKLTGGTKFNKLDIYKSFIPSVAFRSNHTSDYSKIMLSLCLTYLLIWNPYINY